MTHKNSRRFKTATTVLYLATAIFFVEAIAVAAQNVEFTDGKADKSLKSAARVNPVTKAMEFNIPLAGYPGRGGNSTRVSLSYSSKTWRMDAASSYRRRNPYTQQFEPVTVLNPKFGERSASGWTSSLVAPRIEAPFNEHFQINGDPSLPDTVVGGLPQVGPHCAGFPEGGSSQNCVVQSVRTVCTIAPIQDNPDGIIYDCTRTVTFMCIYSNFSYTVFCENVIDSPPIADYRFIRRVRVYMPDGSSHEFRKDDLLHLTPVNASAFVGTFLSVDGTGMRLELGAEGQGSTLHLPEGGRYLFAANEPVHDSGRFASEYVDVNGNRTQFTRTVNSNNKIVGTVTDSLGRITTDPLYQNKNAQPEAGTQNVSLTGINGSPRSHNLVWTNLAQAFDSTERQLKYPGTCENDQQIPTIPANQTLFQTASTFSTKICETFGVTQSLFNPVVLSEILLPNGQNYRFRYNEYGEITEIKHPSGAVEKFEYEVVPQIGTFTSFDYAQANRGVKKHWIYENEQATPQLWQHGAGLHILAPDGSWTQTMPFYSPDASFGFEDPRSGMVKEEKSYDTNNQLRSRKLTDWIVKSVPTDFGNVMRDARPVRTFSIAFEGGKILATMSETDYETPGENGSTAPTDPSYFAHLNAKRSKSYHYLELTSAEANAAYDDAIINLKNKFYNTGQIANISETDYSYDPNYKARGITSRPIETRVLNPANTNDVLAKTQMVYDETAYQDFGYTTTGWVDPNSTLRGNVTTTKTWVKETDTWLETHAMYDNFGNVRKVWDTSGDATRFVEVEYSSTNYYAYPTKTKAPAPDPTGVHGMTEGSEISRHYDFNTGLLLSVTDANGQTATNEYDNLLRPTRVNPPVGGSVSETIYNDTPGNLWVKRRQQIDEYNWAESTTYFDNLGRAVKSRTKDLQGDVASEIRYDSFGRVKAASNPYRVDTNGYATEPVYWSKPRYDDINRVVETYAPALVDPNSSAHGPSMGVVQFGISTEPNLIGGYTIATDASGRKARAISGIYGLIRVDEATAIGGTVDQDLGTLANPNQPTSYSYNVKGELVKITQGKSGQPTQYRYFAYDSLGRLVRVRQPEQTPNPTLATTGNPDNNSWTAAFSYDVFGNVVSMTDAKNTTITNEYDRASRPVKRTYSDGTPQLEFFYDGKGLPQVPQFSRGALTKATSSVSEDRFTSFDNHGRLLASQQITDGQTYGFGYKYNLSGGLIEETYPSGRIVRNFLHNDGGLNLVTTKAANGFTKQVASNFDYTAAGGVRKMKLGNGLWETAQVNERFQLTQVGLGTTNANNNLFKIDYEYGELSADGTTVDAEKNIGMIARTMTTIPTTSFTQTFKYDSINRLTEAKENTGTTTNWQQTFGYDRFGNRTQFSQTINGNPIPNTSINHPTIDATNNRFTTGQGYVYDFNGNLLNDAEGRSFTFNGDDKQTEVRNASDQIVGQYFYDGSGARVKKVVPSTGETTVFVYDAGGSLAAEYSTVAPQPNPTTSYLTTDHLGSPRVITDKSGNVISRRDHMPFGEELGVGIGGRNESQKYSVIGSDNLRKRFTGYEKDDETQLDFAEARMYQNKHGRFTAVDPLLSSAIPTNPQTFNRYTYTGNNPINYTDPSGLKWCRNKSDGGVNWSGGNCSDGQQVIDRTEGMLVNGGCLKGASSESCYSAGSIIYYNPDGTTRLVRSSTIQKPVQQGQSVAGASQSIPGTDAATAAASSTVPDLGDHASPSGQRAPEGALPLPCPADGGCGHEPLYSNPLTQGATEEELDNAQLALDTIAATEIPVVSQGAGVISAITDLARGRPVDGLIGLGGLTPVFGNVLDAAKAARRANRVANDARRTFSTITDKTTVGSVSNIATNANATQVAKTLTENGHQMMRVNDKTFVFSKGRQKTFGINFRGGKKGATLEKYVPGKKKAVRKIRLNRQ
ncbi:MAG: RHS repeat-associated core domain-containing protein [Pyrinomonadaceae bacterium]